MVHGREGQAKELSLVYGGRRVDSVILVFPNNFIFGLFIKVKVVHKHPTKSKIIECGCRRAATKIRTGSNVFSRSWWSSPPPPRHGSLGDSGSSNASGWYSHVDVGVGQEGSCRRVEVLDLSANVRVPEREGGRIDQGRREHHFHD